MPPTARAETVGSLLRPAYLYEARQKARDGQSSLQDLRAAEDAAILEAIELQKSVGLDVITDGGIGARAGTRRPAFSRTR